MSDSAQALNNYFLLPIVTMLYGKFAYPKAAE